MSVQLNETKVIQTKNSTAMIDSANKRNSYFGWNVQSVQVTHVKDSHLEFREKAWDVEVRSVTETTEYATITYTRNRALPRLAELQDMERKYTALENEWEAQWNIRVSNEMTFKPLLLLVVAVVASACNGALDLVADLCLYGGIAITILLNVLRAPKRKAADAEMKNIVQKKRVIEEACENLLAQIMQ